MGVAVAGCMRGPEVDNRRAVGVVSVAISSSNAGGATGGIVILSGRGFIFRANGVRPSAAIGDFKEDEVTRQD